MEGCPRSLMLKVDLKETFPTEFTPSLKTYIREHYHEDADSYKNECSQLEQLRTASVRPSQDHSGCSTLRRYYAQLQFLQSRFPLGEGEAVNVQFTWTDLYSEEPISLYDIKFEQAAILHNLAALHSQLGYQEDRTAEEGMKVACTHFQAAAGIFQYLKVGSFCKVEHFIDNFASDAFFDMASGLLQLYTNVMLGQAQECLLEKSILDSRKDSLIARISMQVHDYYKQALQFLDSQGPSFMGSRKAKIWTKNLKIKCCQYLAVAYIYMSNNADENQKFGEKVAYLKAASQKVTEAQKASKGQPERTLELLQFLVDVVSNKLQGAVKDNDFIYHEVVPELDALPEIKAAPLVKPIPFQPTDPSVSGPDIFQRLIPMEAHTDSSLYSEEKANLLRRYVSSIEQKNQVLSKALGDLHIDDLLEPEGYDTLPAVIRQKSDSLKKDENSLKDVENNIEELTKVGSKVEDVLTSLAKMLEEDKQKEKELVELVGPMTPPPERKDFERDLEQCQESHKKATQTNTELLKVFKEHKHNLDLLTGPSEGLIAALPSLNIIDTPIDDGAVQRLRDLISKVDQMKSQRKQLEADLRKQLADDDITQQLVTRQEGNKMVFFEEQLKKHDGTCALIQANLDAQPKILKALTEANAKYAPTRQAVKETAQRRDDAVQSFVLSHDTFLELKEKLSRGLRFYQSLEKTVLKLEEKIKEFYENRKKEMAKIEEKEKKAKEKAKPPPARPEAAKPGHLIRPPASTVPGSPAGQFPGGPVVPNPGIRPGTPNFPPQGVPFHPRVPGGVFPPGAFPGATPPHSTDGRLNLPGAPGGPTRPSVPPGDPRVRAPQPVPGVPPQTFQEQRVPQPPASQVPGPAVLPSMHPRPTVPFSQVGPRGSVPAEHLIHSTPRMSYPVPVGPSLPPGSQPGFQPGLPGGPVQVSQPPGEQPRPPFAAGQVSGPGGVQGLPSYDQAKFIPGSQQLSRPQQPPVQSQQNWPQGQHPASSQQQTGGNLSQTFPSQQQFQSPRGPHPTSQPQHPSQAGSPQRYQPPIPSNPMSQTPQSVSGQQPPRIWQSQPFQFPKLAQQHLRPQQPQQPLHPQQPLQPQPPLQPQQPLQLQKPLQPQPQLQPQQPLQPQQKFQQPQQPYQRQQQPQPPPSQLPYQQPTSSQQLPQPLQPQTMPPAHPQMQNQFQPQPPLASQQPSQFQQQPQQRQLQQPSQPPQQFQQPMQQFKQPPQHQQQFPQQQIPQPKVPIQQPPQFQPTLPASSQPQQLPQQKSPLQPQQNFQLPLQPLQPQKPQPQPKYLQPLQPHQSGQPLQDQQFSKDLRSQQSPYPGQTLQNLQASQGQLKPQNVGRVPDIPPKGQPQIGQMPGISWEQQMSSPPPKPSMPGYAPQQSYTGYSPGPQQLPPGSKSVPPDYPLQLDKQRSQQPKQGFLSQQSGPQGPGGFLTQQNAFPSSSSGWPYPQVSQPLPSTGASLSSQPLQRQDLKEQSFGGKSVQGPLRSQPYRQTQVDQGWTPTPTTQQLPKEQPRREQVMYPPGIARQDSTDYCKQSQYPGQRSQASSYPPYSSSLSEPPPSPSSSQPYISSQGTTPSAPPLVQGVRPSPVSVPSSAYVTSYSVSVAQAQLNQQQQMQQLQTQMLLQQQQLILQQQELLRHQQQQQQHDSDQGQLAQLFQQVLQQQTKLAEMEQKLKEHESHEEPLDKAHTKEDHKEEHKEIDKDPVSSEKDKETNEKDLNSVLPQSSSSFSASWGSGFSDHDHGKLDMEQVFSDLAKKQISEISEKGKHVHENINDTKAAGHLEPGAPEHSEKELVGDKSTEGKEESGGGINSAIVITEAERNEKCSSAEMSVSNEIESNTGKNSSSSTEQKSEARTAVDSSPSNESQPEVKPQQTEHSTKEDKEKRRLQEVEEQIQKIKELQKNYVPPLPPKAKYLYEPGKMPELGQLPIKPPDTKPTVEPNKPSLHRQCGHYYETQQSSIGQEENNECLSEEEYIQKLSHTVETFDALVMNLEQKREGSPYNGFINEWKVLEKMQESDCAIFATQAAILNPSKNRYRDILPWDHTRVTLNTKEGGDYINANIIKNVTPLSPDYILTQGPIASTLGDFWLMVWERKSPVIVMLTKEVEGNRLKCHQYWPIDEGHTVVYGEIRVHMRSLTHCQAWIERIMHVQHAESDEVLVVSHLQFIGWPDHGVPHSPSDLLTFLSEVRNNHKERDPNVERPLVVHCSAGVGRAGTFCVIYTAIRELNGTGNIVHIPKLVRTFRKHRKFTVQKKEQYEFCYRAILFYANQFVQLEKTAIAFKKSKNASADQLDDVSSSSSMTSLNDSGQRTSEKVSFLGEISDEDSSDSDSEFEKAEEDDLIERKNLQESAAGGLDGLKNENRRTEEESSEPKDLSNTTVDSSSVKDTPGTSEKSTSSTDHSVVRTYNENNKKDKESSEINDSLSATDNSASVVKDTPGTCEKTSSSTDHSAEIDKSEGKSELQESPQAPINTVDADNTSVDCETSSSNTDVSAVISSSEGKKEEQDASQLSSSSVGTSDVGESPATDSNPSAMIVQSEGKMTVDSSTKQEDRSGDEKSSFKDNVREFIEGSLGRQEMGSDKSKEKGMGADETKEECPLAKEEMKERVEETKREKMSESNEKERTNIDLSVCKNDEQNTESELSVEKNNSQLQPKTEEELPESQQEQENEKSDSSSQDEVEKQQENEVQLNKEKQQKDENSKEQNKEEIHEQQNSNNTELNNEQDSKKKPARHEQVRGDEVQASGPQTTQETESPGKSLQQNTQDKENKQTSET